MHVVDGEFQIDDGDEHLCKLRSMPKYEIMTSKADRADSMNPDRAATVTVSERSIGRYMRLFTFPKNVYMGGLRAELEDGLLRINVPKTHEALNKD